MTPACTARLSAVLPIPSRKLRPLAVAGALSKNVLVRGSGLVLNHGGPGAV